MVFTQGREQCLFPEASPEKTVPAQSKQEQRSCLSSEENES